jgi:hypothetical protein
MKWRDLAIGIAMDARAAIARSGEQSVRKKVLKAEEMPSFLETALTPKLSSACQVWGSHLSFETKCGYLY